MKPKLIVLAGPTASGKTGLSLRLAGLFPLEIVSADSMQIYKGLDIATAKPTPAERGTVPHHMLDILDPPENYSAGDYARDATVAVEDILSRGKIPLLVGGTGFYIRSLLFPPMEEGSTDIDNIAVDTWRRYFLEREDTTPGFLWRTLRAKDPERALKLHPKDRQRLVRALELMLQGGKKASSHQMFSPESPYDFLYFTLDYPDRSLLWQRIDLRIQQMVAQGLEEEVRRVINLHLPETSTCMQAIGYKEFAGGILFVQGLQTLSLHTRQYAKRQSSWFRNEKDTVPIVCDGETDPFDKIADRIRLFLEENS